MFVIENRKKGTWKIRSFERYDVEFKCESFFTVYFYGKLHKAPGSMRDGPEITLKTLEMILATLFQQSLFSHLARCNVIFSFGSYERKIKI